MNKIKKILQGGVLALFVAVAAASPAFADCKLGENSRFPNLSFTKNSTYSVYCTRMQQDNGSYKSIYGKTSGDCAQAATVAADPDRCKGDDLVVTVRTVINAVIFVVGLIAVVMTILGGVNYATSMGDPSKVKKAKDTIMYGIIGLVIAILAFAIVNFVLSALNAG